MVPLTEYFISSVKYNFEHTQIISVTRHLYQSGNIARGNIVNRSIVLDDLRNGLKYKTIYRTPDGKWKIGKEIQIIPNTEFITTNPDVITKDDLGMLPEF
jgi:hypothetical protein